MLLAWKHTTVIGHAITVWRGLGAGQVATVCDGQNEAVLRELGRLGFPKESVIMNARPEDGMFGSIRCAARWEGWNSSLSHWIISLGDQPHLRPETFGRLIEQAGLEPERIWQPSRGGKARHPVLLPRRVFLELAGAKDATLRDFLEARGGERSLFESDDAGLDLDLDTREDYERARRRMEGGSEV